MKQFLLSFALLSTLYAQTQRQPVWQLSYYVPGIQAYTHANIVISADKTLEDATLLVREGMIEAVGKDVVIPPSAQVQELKGMWIYPGFIDAYADYGNPVAKGEFDNWSERQYESKETRPYYWNDAVKSHFDLIESFEVKADKAENLRAMGFSAANILPKDGIFRGTGILTQLGDGKAKQEILVAKSAASLSFLKGSSKQTYPNSFMGAVALIRQTLLDAQQYQEAEEALRKNPNQTPLKLNLSLAAINAAKEAKMPAFFEVNGWQQTLKAAEVAKEFEQKWILKTKGDEFKRIDAIQKTGVSLVVPLTFPKPFQVQNALDAREIDLERLKNWEQAPRNLALLAEKKIAFALTAEGVSKEDFWANLRKAIVYGLSEKDALRALTETPAQYLGVTEWMGTLEKGKIANFSINSENIFSPTNQLYDLVLAGKIYNIKKHPNEDMRGDYRFQLAGIPQTLRIYGDAYSPKLRLFTDKDSLNIEPNLNQQQIAFTYNLKGSGNVLFSGIWEKNKIEGTANLSSGERVFIEMKRTGDAPFYPNPKNKKDSVNLAEISPVSYPNKAYGFHQIPQQGDFLIKNATVWTNTTSGKLENTDVLLSNGEIQKVGKNLSGGKDIVEIDGTGKHLSAGIIDEHSHIAISGGVNEGSHTVTAEVRIGDALDTEDINIYRQLAGGVTAAQLLHGSANPIGGQSQIIKLRWGATPEELKFKEAPAFIKFALGENVKQSNHGEADFATRYPQTRAGVEQIIKDVFLSAKDYKEQWEIWEKSGKRHHLAPPQRDLQLETLLEILEGKRFITCHSYVQSEILMLMRLGEEVGFKVNTFTHILEGYKLADKMKAHGANASTFADWWGYKVEVQEAIPHNASIMQKQGLNVCVNSDDAEMGRRLNQEAAKSVKYGGMSEEEALKMVTLNPAKALHIDKYVGSIEKGKQADVVLWSDNPLSIYAKVLYTWVDGRKYYDYQQDIEMQQQVVAERKRILDKMQKAEGAKADPAEGAKKSENYHCDSVEESYE